MSDESKRKIRRLTRDIRQAIDEMDYVSSGTMHIRTKVCGRSNCRCATDPDARHGPYYEWSRRIGGRLVHTVLSEEQAEMVAEAIANHREIQRLLTLWEARTTEEIIQVEEE